MCCPDNQVIQYDEIGINLTKMKQCLIMFSRVKNFFGFRPREPKKLLRIETQQPTLTTAPEGSYSSPLSLS